VTLYDVELWRAGHYCYTLSGPYTGREAAERDAVIERQRIRQEGDEVRVTPFDDKSSDTHAQGRREA